MPGTWTGTEADMSFAVATDVATTHAAATDTHTQATTMATAPSDTQACIANLCGAITAAGMV